jgi:hypothetical protein
MNVILSILIFIVVSLILIKLFFYLGKMYGYMMIMFILFVVLPVGYFIKRFYLDNQDIDYMVYYQNDIDVNEIEEC